MKNFNTSKLLILFLTVITINSCGKRIPLVYSYEKYHLSRYGAYMEVKIQGLQNKLNVKGELIFADNKKIIIRTLEKPNNILPYAIKDLISYQLYYAKNDNEDYTGWNFLNHLTTLAHGWFLILSVPINSIIGGSVSTSKDAEFRYSNKELPLEQLYKYARYPTSLPPGIGISNLNDLL
ncbi:MAG: hypothetical protein IPN86_02405 [Saprospiraceae bacterium]|nr:hypothetical protein [Saprospiraceae bacterium]